MSKHTQDTRRIASALERIATPASAERFTDRTGKKEMSSLGPQLWLAKTFLVSDGKSSAARRARRSFPIHAYVGPNGGGKSACMVNDTIPSLEAGRTVLSTVRLINPATGEDYDSYVKFEDWDQLLELRHADVLMDEMVGIANSRGAMGLDQRVQNVLVQLRRRDIALRWSAPNWARADKIIREVTQAVTECRGYYPDRRLVRADSESGVQLWAPKRLFDWKTYDTLDFEEWTAGKRDKLQSTVRERYFGPGSTVFQSYDTLDDVAMVAGITELGLCNICNKKLRVENCKGHTDAEKAQHGHRFEDLGSVELIAHDHGELEAGTLEWVPESASDETPVAVIL